MSPLASPSSNLPTPTTSLRERINALPEWEKLPIIEVRVGSDSDFPKIRKILEWLRDYPVLVRIASAHRTPHEMAAIAQAFPEVLLVCEGDSQLLDSVGNRIVNYSKEDQGLVDKMEVIFSIACAGWAAQLPGMTAAETYIPTVGFSVPSSILWQIDSLLANLNMPPGTALGMWSKQKIIAEVARLAYDNHKNISDKIYLGEWVVLDKISLWLIEKFWLKTTKVIQESHIGIYKHRINEWRPTWDHSERWLQAFGGNHIPLVTPTIRGRVLNNSSWPNAWRTGCIIQNLMKAPGLLTSMQIQEEEKYGNSILFAARVRAIMDRPRDAHIEYNRELAKWARKNDNGVVAQQLL